MIDMYRIHLRTANTVPRDEKISNGADHVEIHSFCVAPRFGFQLGQLPHQEIG
jgi:hypothetical protein